MADIDLSQSEADALIAMPKTRINDETWSYPGTGGLLTIPLTSEDKRENFLLDMSRGRIELRKGKYQMRGHQIIVLVRLDFGGAPHRNPDGVDIPSPHLHVYREGYGHKWAFPISVDRFPNLTDLWQTLHDFMDYCNVVDRPDIQRGLYV